MHTQPGASFMDPGDHVTYTVTENTERPMVRLHIGDLTIFAKQPSDLTLIANVAYDAADRLNEHLDDLGWVTCDCCSRKVERTERVRAGDNDGDICAACVALMRERVA